MFLITSCIRGEITQEELLQAILQIMSAVSFYFARRQVTYLPLTNATPCEMEVQSVNMVQDFPLAAARLDDVQAHTAKDDTIQVLT